MIAEAPPAPPAAPPAAAPPVTPVAPAEPFYKDWLQSDGSLNTKSYDRLPEHLKGLRPTLERQKNIEGVLQNLDHLQKVASGKALAALPPDASKELVAERKAIMDANNGVPKTPQEYGLARPKDIPENLWNAKLVDGVAKWAHDNSIAPASVNKLINDVYLTEFKGQLQAQAAGETKFWAEQQKVFETNIQARNLSSDKAQALVEKGAMAFGLKLDDEQTKNFLKGAQSRLMCIQFAIATGEDTSHVPGDGGSGGGGDLDARIKEARADPAYGNYENKFTRTDHEAAVERVNALLRMKVGQSKARR